MNNNTYLIKIKVMLGILDPGLHVDVNFDMYHTLKY